ncbi:MAG: MFS transporter [Scrofimicrobium sp.]
MSKTFQSFQYYNYRLWFAGNLLAASGTWMQRIAQDWLVLTHLSGGSGLQLGIVTALQFAPILFLSPTAGVFADRFDKRMIIQVTQALTALLGLAMGVLVLTDTVQLWMVYIFATAGGIISAMENPVRQAFVSELVPTRILPNAVALNSTSFNLARLLGPAISGFVIDWVGIGWVFIVNAALFLGPVFTVLFMRERELLKSKPAPREKGQIRQAVHYVRGRRDIILILVIVGVVSLLGLNFQVTSAMMATEVYGLPAGGFGLMSTTLAVGAVAGSLGVARLNKPRLRMIVAAALFFGMLLTLLALAPTYIWFLIIAVPVGMSQQILIASANAAVQITTAPGFRGRVMALYSMIFMGVTPIGSPLIGWIAEHFGARWSMAVGGLASMAVAIGVALFGYFHWKIRLQIDDVTHKLHLNVPISPVRSGYEDLMDDSQIEAQASLDLEEQITDEEAELK